MMITKTLAELEKHLQTLEAKLSAYEADEYEKAFAAQTYAEENPNKVSLEEYNAICEEVAQVSERYSWYEWTIKDTKKLIEEMRHYLAVTEFDPEAMKQAEG